MVGLNQNMKINFNPYLKALFKENFIYILTTFILIIITVSFFLIYLPQLWELDKKNQQLTQENKVLNNRLYFINNYFKNEPIDLHLKILYSLIPVKEDYFSIIYTLDNLSKITGFLITSYTINLSQSTPEKLKITVTGTGDKQAFMNFLQKYNFAGGRLVTADEITLSETEMSEMNINLTFYNAPIDNISLDKYNLEAFKKQINKIDQIVNQIESSINLEENVNNITNIDYPKKTNPF